MWYWYLSGFQSAIMLASIAFNVWFLHLGQPEKKYHEPKTLDIYNWENE